MKNSEKELQIYINEKHSQEECSGFIDGFKAAERTNVSYMDNVEAFHKLMDAPVLQIPQIPNEKRAQLRIALIQEELNEFKQGIEKGDLLECLDALCDIQYVLSGAILEFGLQRVFNNAFLEVQRSNMSKACESMEIAEATVKHYETRGFKSYIEPRDGMFFVKRLDDDKVLKSITYSEADLKPFLNGETSV